MLGLINLVIWLLIIGILYWLALYVIRAIPIPEPPARFIIIAVTVVAVLFIIQLLLQMIGVSTGMDIPRVTPQ